MSGQPTFRASIEDIEQHEIAAGILLNVLRMAVEHPGMVDANMAHGLLMIAASERDRQGDYRASLLLEEWAEDVRGEPGGEEMS